MVDHPNSPNCDSFQPQSDDEDCGGFVSLGEAVAEVLASLEENRRLRPNVVYLADFRRTRASGRASSGDAA